MYVQPFPGPGAKHQISTDGGHVPAWSPDGRELFYRNGDKLMAVEIETQPMFRAGIPRLLFERRWNRGQFSRGEYDISPDGKRFLMIKPVDPEESPPTQINVVLNWFEELKAKVPVR